MAAILKLRRGSSFTNPSISEPFFNTDSNILQVGYGTTTGEHITLVKIGENTGNISFSGDITGSNLSLSGNAVIAGNITLGGDIFLGDGDNTTDKIVVNASLSGSLLPDTDNEYDLGANNKRYKNLHVVSASIENLQVGGSGILSSSNENFADYSSSIDSRLISLNNYTQSNDLDITELFSTASNHESRIVVIETTFSSSVDSRLVYLEGDFSSSVDSRLNNQEAFSESLDATFEEIASGTHTLVSGSSQIDVNTTQNFQSFSSSVDNRLDEVESTSSINETNITELFSTSSNHEGRVIELESTGSDHENRIDLLESFSSSLDNTFVTETELNSATSSLSASLTLTDDDFEDRINTLETTFSSSVDTRLDEIETTFSSSVDSRLDFIEGTFSQSVDIRLDETESTGSEHESRLDNIELYTASLDNTYEEKASGTHTLFSGSSQVNADTITNFDSNVKTKLDLDTVVSSSVQITISDTTGYATFSSSIATTDEGQNDRLDNIELYTASVDSLYEEIASGTHTLVSGSSQIQIDSVSGFTAHSSSVDSRLDSLEGDSHTHSNKAQLDVINQDLSNTSNVTFNDITASGNVIVSGDLTVLGTATEIQTSDLYIKDKLITVASGSTNSAEADGSGIEIDGAGKSIIWDDATQSFILNAKVSSSVGFKGDGSELENVTASDVEYLNVLNKPTLVSGSSQISFTGITDKPTLFSGSSQVNADTITNFDSNVKDKLNSDSVVSGSSGEQLTASLDLRYLEINGDNVFSGSSQVNADTITNFDSNVKDKMNLDNVVSGSSQITNGSGILSSSNENFTTFSSSVDTRLDEIETTFSSSVDSRLDFIEGTFSSSVDSRLDAQEAFSESLDNEFLNTNGDNVVSGSDQVTSSLDLRYEEKASATHTLVSGSSQIDVTQTINIETIATTGSNLFDGDQIISGTLSTSGVVSFQDVPWPFVGEELHILKTQPYTLNLQSGNRTYEYAGIALEHFEASPSYYHNSILLYSYDNHSTPNYGTELNIGPLRNHMRVYPSSSVVGIDTASMANISIEDLQNGTSNALIYADYIQLGGFNSEEIQIGNPNVYLEITATSTNVNSNISSSNFISASAFIGDGSQLENVVASEITYENITGLPSGIVSGSSQIDVTQTTNYSSIRQYDNSDNTTHLNSLGVVSGSTYSSPSQGTLRATINGANSDVDLGLQSTDTPTFNSLTASNLPEHGIDIYDAVLKGTSGEFGYRTLGSSAFYMVSNSLDISLDTGSFNDSVLLTAGAVKTYVNEYVAIVGAADITGVTAGDGISGGADSGEAIITLDTGSQHFIDGVTGIAPTLPDGLVSGSDQVTQSLDTRYVNASGDTISGDLVISGDLTVNGTTTTINTTNLNVEDNIIELNFGGSATNGGLLVKDVTGGSTTSGSLLWDGTNDYWIAGINGVESKILLANGDGVLSGSLSTQVKPVLDNENVHSGSYLGTATTSNLDEGINLYWTQARFITASNNEGFISSSIQILGGSNVLSSSNETFTQFSSSVDSRFGALSTDYNDLQNVPSGIVSSSTQISVYNTFLEIGGDDVISGSSQVQIDSVTGFTTFSSSVDTRIDLLEAFSSSLDAGFVTEAELNTATQSLQDSIDLKLNISTYTPFSTSVDSRLDGLEGVTSENPLTFNDTTTIDLIRTGDVITANVIGGVVSGSSQVIGILDSLNTYTSSNDTNQTTQDGRLNNLELYTSSVDNLYEEKASGTHTLVSGSSQVLIDSVTNFTPFSSSVDSRILSLEGDIHTHTNKANLDTINQNLSTTSDVQFNDIEIDGTGSFGSNVTIYGNLTIFGTESIINSENLAIADNMIYLNSGSTITNPDLGWAGNYNDGTYAHAGLFRDASDGGTFKVYEGYTPEPSGSIDTAHASFTLADFQANAVIGNGYVLKNSGGSTIGTLTTDGTNVALASGAGLSLLTTGGTDGVIINANGDTTIYGKLALQDIPTAGTATSALVVGGSNVVSQRTLGTNAFDSTDNSATYEEKASATHTLVSGSSQVNADTITNFDSNVLAYNNSLGVVSGSSQVTLSSAVGYGSLLRSDADDTASGIITFSNTTQSTTNTTGAVIVSGGVGIAKTLNVGEDVVAYASSDRRLKDNILPIENPLQKINSIGGYSFDWNVEKQHIYKGKDYGVIAQEIEEILPELVDTRENGYKAVKYDKLVSLLIEGIKELSQEVNELKQQIKK